ncbi:MAG: hypothetical protein ACUVWZ_07405 [Anaerolineae bacterium]
MRESNQQPDQQLIEQIVGKISQWNLIAPAILLLEIAKPFGFLASQGLYLCEPLLGFFSSEARLAHYADLLAETKSVEALIARLERERAGRTWHSKEES